MAPAFLSASGPLPHPTHHYHMQQQQHAAYAQTGESGAIVHAFVSLLRLVLDH